MKKVLLSATVLLAAIAGNAQTDKKNLVKANLFSPLVKSGSFFYERQISDNKSAQLGVGFTSYNKSGVGLNGIFITPEFRFYPGGEALTGFYVGPFLRYQNLKISDKDNYDMFGNQKEVKSTLSTFGGGVVVGRQWVFGNIISLDIFGGPSINTGKVKYDDGEGNTEIPGSFSGFGARIGVTLGVNF